MGGGVAHFAAAHFFPNLPRGAALLALGLMLTACAPDLGAKPDLQMPDQLATTQSFQAPATSWPSTEWWKGYDDPELNALIDEALHDSPSLKIAAARLKAAMAAAGISEANLWPTVNASGSVAEAEVSQNQMGVDMQSFMPQGWHHQAQIGADIGYQLDFFGKNRAALAAATSAAEAAAADHAEARLQLAAGIATAYAGLVQLTKNKALAEDALRQRQESAALVRKRAANGLDNQGSVAMAEAQVWGAHQRLDTVERLLVATRNQIAALLGKGPDRGRSIKVLPKRHLKPAGLPEKLALDLIGRRPDIVAAKMRAQAAAKGIDIANANFYPDVNLVGMFGLMSLDAGVLLNAKSETGQVGAAFSLPIFDYGRLTNVYRQARADYDAAAAAYDMTLSQALNQTATAYNNRKSADIELRHAQAMLAAAEEAYAVIHTRYSGGLAPYTDVLTAETQLIDQKRNVADLETNAFATDVALKKALGGGYDSNNQSGNQE